ncbi:MAG TPA: COX15/CtaA family protein [Methylomirabilota bacterium]|nr:COX15/CtaA family protein [Methylomirabilota bacterium]
MSLATSPAAPVRSPIRASPAADRAIRIWLWTVAMFVLAMVVVGGATRLTESGLSITEWKPVMGALPPLTESDWLSEFDKYRQIPEYQQINKGMSLADFKTIYWWEWGHRLLGRVIGFVFAVPFIVFAARGWISRSMLPRLGLLFVLGGLQGAVGWWMVVSGLTERTDVSQYRLAIHLTLACVILVAAVWIAEGFRERRLRFAEVGGLRAYAAAIVGLTLVQIFLGGLVAGLNAGYVYNTWPLMDGDLLPAGLLFQSPWWINFFENHLTVQFVHRIGAYLLVALVIAHFVAVYRRALEPETIRRSTVLMILVLAQAGVGIATLLLVVPLSLALLHQATAAVLLIVATVHARRLAD